VICLTHVVVVLFLPVSCLRLGIYLRLLLDLDVRHRVGIILECVGVGVAVEEVIYVIFGLKERKRLRSALHSASSWRLSNFDKMEHEKVFATDESGFSQGTFLSDNESRRVMRVSHRHPTT
jgi:hypothetical protein